MKHAKKYEMKHTQKDESEMFNGSIEEVTGITIKLSKALKEFEEVKNDAANDRNDGPNTPSARRSSLAFIC